jgi:hypothetical protein
MPALPAFDRNSAILERIAASASRSQRLFSDHCGIAEPPRAVSSRPIQCSLPLPEPLTDDLIRLGCNASSAAQISDLYVRTANELRSVVEKECIRTVLALRPHFVTEALEFKCIATHKSHYMKTIDSITEEIKKRVHTRLLSISGKIAKRRFLSHDPDGLLRRTRRNRRTTFNNVSCIVTCRRCELS